MRPSRAITLPGGAFGNSVEWCDWTSLGLLSSVFAPQIISKGSAVAPLVGVLLAFAPGFLMRPIGSLVLSLLANGPISADDEMVIVHGTTVSTNAVIERSGAPLGLSAGSARGRRGNAATPAGGTWDSSEVQCSCAPMQRLRHALGAAVSNVGSLHSRRRITYLNVPGSVRRPAHQ